MEQPKLVENFWAPNTHIHQILPAISSPAALNQVIAKLFQFSISRSTCLSSSLPATETVRHRARAATSLSDQLPPRNRWHLVILSLSSFSELSESSLGNPRNSREKFWRSNGSTVLMMIINDSGSHSMSLWSEKVFLWRILKASWKEQSLTWKLKHKGPFELGQIHPHLVKCWSYILDMMVLFGFSSNGSSINVFHISTLIPYDSIRDTPSCHHPLCHPPPLPPLKESIVIFILPKMFPKVQFSFMSFTKKNGHQQINKLEKRCPKNIKAFGFAALLTFLAFTFAGFIILPMGQSHKATGLKLIEKFKQLYV